MLIDRLKAFLPYDRFTSSDWVRLSTLTDRIQRVCPRTGAIAWESSVWSSERSDSHYLSFRVAGAGLWLSGSPAKVMGDGCAVFGSGASQALDLEGCLRAMWEFFLPVADLADPPEFRPADWHLTAIDVTDNLVLRDLDEVHQVLAILRGVEGGRYKVSAQAGQTVYWQHRSRLRSAKAYAKGPHLAYMQGRRDYTGREYSPDEIAAAGRLLRLELMLKGEWCRRNPEWWKLTATDLKTQWLEYFGRMNGEQMVRSDEQLTRNVFAMAQTEGRARAALGCWAMIQAVGWVKAQQGFAPSTWYRHLALLHAAGLSDADVSHGKVVPLVFRVHEAVRVSSWSDLMAA